jgi:hypothetical protein
MAQFQRRNPYQPGYATPNYVYGEPPGRGTLTTKGLPRGTIDTVDAHRSRGGYAIPGYVLSETQGRGAYDTDMLPRRWVDTKTPDTLMRPFPEEKGSLAGTVFSKKTLNGSSLGDVNAYGRRQNNPFRLYGVEAVRWIEKHILQNRSLSPEQKKAALNKVLNRIDPKLHLVIGRKAEAYRQQGDLPGVALRKAMADALAEGLMNEVQGLGRRGLSGTPGILGRRLRGVGALGAAPSSAPYYQGVGDYSGPRSTTIEVAGYTWPVIIETNGVIKGTKTFTSPGGFTGLKLPTQLRVEVENHYKKYGSGILGTFFWCGGVPQIRFRRPNSTRDHGIYVSIQNSSGKCSFIDKDIRKAVVTIKEIPPPDKSLLDRAVGGVTGIVLFPVKVVGEVVKGAVDVVEDVVDKVGGLACKVVNSDLGVVAAGTAGGAYGGPAGAQAGMMGAQIGQSICGKAPPPPPPVETSSFPILPLALAAGGVVLVYLAVKE